MKIEFEFDDEFIKWVRHYQCFPIVKSKASEEMKKLTVNDFCKAIVSIYIVERMKQDGKI